MDLTARLQNYSLDCRNRARIAREDAARIRAEPRTNWEAHDRQIETRVEQKEAEAKMWTRRARKAEAGFLLVDEDDQEWILGNHGLIRDCSAGGRIVYVASATEPTD